MMVHATSQKEKVGIMDKKVNRMSFSLSEEYRQLLKEIIAITRRTGTEEIRILLDQRAQELGLKPVTPVAPRKQKKGS